MQNNNLKFIQIVLAVLIGIGLVSLFTQRLWMPKIIKFKLEQEGIYNYYIEATENFDI